MTRNLWTAAVLLILCPIIVFAAQDDCEFKLSDDNDLNNASIGLSCSLTDSQDIGLGQHISVDDSSDTDGRWEGVTRGHYDFHYNGVDFGSGKLRPFIGANAGYTYGSHINKSLTASPEVGVTIHVQPTTLIRVQAEYQALYHDGDQIDDAFNDGFLMYSLGLGFYF
jgi:hypothetical protein